MAKKKRTAARSDDSQPSFEEALKELEETVRLLEDGQLGLGESLARYEEGVQHLQRCQQLLKRAERKIELLSGVDAEGNPATKPFDDGELSLEEKADTRTKRRSSAQSAAKQENSGDIDEGSRLF
jgi:exodeoxyribonuclease VII small subunit